MNGDGVRPEIARTGKASPAPLWTSGSTSCPETEEPHVYRHAVSQAEVEEVLARPIEDRAGIEGSRAAIGQTRAGRFLRVIYVPDPEPASAFVITAYRLGPKP